MRPFIMAGHVTNCSFGQNMVPQVVAENDERYCANSCAGTLVYSTKSELHRFVASPMAISHGMLVSEKYLPEEEDESSTFWRVD